MRFLAVAGLMRIATPVARSFCLLLLLAGVSSCADWKDARKSPPLSQKNSENAAVAEPEESGVHWLDLPFDDVLRLARGRDRNVLVFVGASWCSACWRMESEILSQKVVLQSLRRGQFLPVRLEVDRESDSSIAERYTVVAYPTVLLVDGRGRELDRIVGATSASEFAVHLDALQSGQRHAMDSLHARLAERPDDAELLLQAGTEEAFNGLVTEARRHLTEVVKQDQDNERGLAAKALFVLAKYIYLRARKEYRSALVTLDELRRRFLESPEAAHAPYFSAMAFHGLGQDARALSVLRAAVAADSSSPEPFEAMAHFCLVTGVGLTEGLDMAARGAELFPGSTEIWEIYARILAAAGDFDGAERAIDRAIALSPDDAYLRSLMRDFERRQRN